MERLDRIGEAGIDLVDLGAGDGEHLDSGPDRCVDLGVVADKAEVGRERDAQARDAVVEPVQERLRRRRHGRPVAGVEAADHVEQRRAVRTGAVIGPTCDRVPNGLAG